MKGRADNASDLPSEDSHCLVPPSVGEDDATLLMQEKFLRDTRMVYGCWAPPAKLQKKAESFCALGNVARPGGEEGRKFDASLHQMIDICPTPKVGALALELVKVGGKDPELHVPKYEVVGLSFPQGSQDDPTLKLSKEICEFYSSQFKGDNNKDHKSINQSVFDETTFAVLCRHDIQQGDTKSKQRKRDNNELKVVGAITFKYFKDANSLWAGYCGLLYMVAEHQKRALQKRGKLKNFPVTGTMGWELSSLSWLSAMLLPSGVQRKLM